MSCDCCFLSPFLSFRTYSFLYSSGEMSRNAREGSAVLLEWWCRHLFVRVGRCGSPVGGVLVSEVCSWNPHGPLWANFCTEFGTCMITGSSIVIWSLQTSSSVVRSLGSSRLQILGWQGPWMWNLLSDCQITAFPRIVNYWLSSPVSYCEWEWMRVNVTVSMCLFLWLHASVNACVKVLM